MVGVPVPGLPDLPGGIPVELLAPFTSSKDQVSFSRLDNGQVTITGQDVTLLYRPRPAPDVIGMFTGPRFFGADTAAPETWSMSPGGLTKLCAIALARGEEVREFGGRYDPHKIKAACKVFPKNDIIDLRRPTALQDVLRIACKGTIALIAGMS